MVYPNPDNDTALHMARLYERSPLLVALFDAADNLRYANSTWRSAFALEPDTTLTWSDLMRRSHATGIGAHIDTDDFEAWLVSTRARRGKQPFRTFEADLCDGRWIYMTETVDEHGWMLSAAFDVSAMRVGERTLRQARDGALRAAQVDALTGISNRAHAVQQLELRLELLRGHQQPCGLVMLDLDYFKKVNDTWGHLAGDLVLKHFAQLAGSTLRRDDCLGRFGGEEFMLLLPNTTPAHVERTVARVLELVRQSRPLEDVPGFGYTCSAGVVMLDPALDATHSIREADRALYAAKAQGRDRLVWGEEQPPAMQ